MSRAGELWRMVEFIAARALHETKKNAAGNFRGTEAAIGMIMRPALSARASDYERRRQSSWKKLKNVASVVGVPKRAMCFWIRGRWAKFGPARCSGALGSCAYGTVDEANYKSASEAGGSDGGRKENSEYPPSAETTAVSCAVTMKAMFSSSDQLCKLFVA